MNPLLVLLLSLTSHPHIRSHPFCFTLHPASPRVSFRHRLAARECSSMHRFGHHDATGRDAQGAAAVASGMMVSGS